MIHLADCGLRDQPNLSAQNALSLNLSKNSLDVMFHEYFPRGIQELNVSRNELLSDSLPLQFPDSLQILNLKKNHIYDFRDIFHFPANLRVLNVKDQPLCEIPNNLPASLEVLKISKTRVNVIQHLPAHLVELQASDCRIRILQNRLPPQMEILNLTNNYLKYASLPMSWGNQLRELYLGMNIITQFPRNLPATVEILHLQKNHITEISGHHFPPNLRVLILSDNPIRRINWTSRRTHPMAFLGMLRTQIAERELENRLEENGWARQYDVAGAWNTPQHHAAAKNFQNIWIRYRIRLRIRTWVRTGRLRQELLATAMSPERAGQFEDISGGWISSHRVHR